MLSINIICIGKLKEKYLRDACEEYAKRLDAFCKVKITELSEYKLPEKPSEAMINTCLQKEGEAILSKVSSGTYLTAMCIEGKMPDSLELSEKIQQLAVDGVSSITFVIGGSYGLSDEVKAAAKYKMSMSRMTFPHQLARVMLLEQIYRAMNIASNGKYHK